MIVAPYKSTVYPEMKESTTVCPQAKSRVIYLFPHELETENTERDGCFGFSDRSTQGQAIYSGDVILANTRNKYKLKVTTPCVMLLPSFVALIGASLNV